MVDAVNPWLAFRKPLAPKTMPVHEDIVTSLTLNAPPLARFILLAVTAPENVPVVPLTAPYDDALTAPENVPVVPTYGSVDVSAVVDKDSLDVLPVAQFIVFAALDHIPVSGSPVNE